MSDQAVVLKVFNNEVDAGVAQQLPHSAGVSAFIFKDDAGAWSLTFNEQFGVRLVVNCSNAEQAHKILQSLFSN